jgi:hypothetical protein
MSRFANIFIFWLLLPAIHIWGQYYKFYFFVTDERANKLECLSLECSTRVSLGPTLKQGWKGLPVQVMKAPLLLVNIRLGWKGLPGTTTLAYSTPSSVLKSFQTLVSWSTEWKRCCLVTPNKGLPIKTNWLLLSSHFIYLFFPPQGILTEGEGWVHLTSLY